MLRYKMIMAVLLLYYISLANSFLFLQLSPGCRINSVGPFSWQYSYSHSRFGKRSIYDYADLDDSDEDYKDSDEDDEETTANSRHYLLCNITSLDAENLKPTGLTKIQPEKITHMDYSGSKLKQIPRDVLSQYVSVREIILTDVELKAIEPGAFQHLQKLISLDLSDNQLETLPAETLSNLKNLTYLNLSNNTITSVPDLKQVSKLEKINLNHNRLSSLNDINLENVSVILISNNSITKLDNVIKMKFRFPTQVDLSFNLIQDVPKGIFPNTTNTDIDLSHNQIKTIVFENLCYYLNVSHNMIESISNLSRCLTRLDASYNQITNIPSDTFNQTTRIRAISLSYNQISKLHVDTFSGLRSLDYLDLDHNNIDEIQLGTFHHLYNLERLDLSYNNLTLLRHGTFSGIHYLNTLILSGNKLKKIHPSLLYHLGRLRYIRLDNNKLENFDFKKIADYNSNIYEISLDKNNITCDWLEEFIYEYKLKMSHFTIKGSSFKVHNINGIACIYNENDTDQTKSNEFTTNSDVIITQPTVKTPVSAEDEQEPDSPMNPFLPHEKIVSNDIDQASTSDNHIKNITQSISNLYVIISILIVLFLIFISLVVLVMFKKHVFHKRTQMMDALQLVESME